MATNAFAAVPVNGISHPYNVILHGIKEPADEVILATFNTPNEFQHWLGQRMHDGSEKPVRDVYRVVAENLSDQDAGRYIEEHRGPVVVLGHLGALCLV